MPKNAGDSREFSKEGKQVRHLAPIAMILQVPSSFSSFSMHFSIIRCISTFENLTLSFFNILCAPSAQLILVLLLCVLTVWPFLVRELFFL